jgi:MFS family permease
MILWSMLYYQPLYYEAVKGYSPIISGVALFPATFTVAPMAVATGFLITILGKYRWAIWLGWAATIVGLGLDTLLDVDTPVYQWALINLVPGVGLGMLFPSMQFSLQASSKPKDLAFAVALFSFFRTFGQAIGVAISGTIFQNQMKLKLMKYPHYASQAGALAKDAAALVEIIKHTPAGQDKLDLQISYVDSIRTVYIVMCALAGVALFAASFIKAYDLNRALESTQGLVTEKKSRARTAEEAVVDDTA